MAVSNSLGIVASGALVHPVGSIISGAASRISVAKTKSSFNGTPIADSAVRSVTHNLRIAYPAVEGNVTDV
jgi:hypothetical protein